MENTPLAPTAVIGDTMRATEINTTAITTQGHTMPQPSLPWALVPPLWAVDIQTCRTTNTVHRDAYKDAPMMTATGEPIPFNHLENS
jgi:hypothetical protein